MLVHTADEKERGTHSKVEVRQLFSDFSLLEELCTNSKPFLKKLQVQPDDQSHGLLTGVQNINIEKKSVPTISG